VIYYYAAIGALLVLFILYKVISSLIGKGDVTPHPDFTKDFDKVEAKSFAEGGCAKAYRIKKRDGSDKTVYMGKVFSGVGMKPTFEPEA